MSVNEKKALQTVQKTYYIDSVRYVSPSRDEYLGARSGLQTESITSIQEYRGFNQLLAERKQHTNINKNKEDMIQCLQNGSNALVLIRVRAMRHENSKTKARHWYQH